MSTTTTLTTNVENKHQHQRQATRDAAEDDAQFQATARGNRAGTLKLRGIPTFTDVHAKRQWMKEHMAAAFRFFGKLGYGEGISGHISMRGLLYLSPFSFYSLRLNDMYGHWLIDD